MQVGGDTEMVGDVGRLGHVVDVPVSEEHRFDAELVLGDQTLHGSQRVHAGIDDGDVVLTLGAGDIYRLAEAMVKGEAP